MSGMGTSRRHNLQSIVGGGGKVIEPELRADEDPEGTKVPLEVFREYLEELPAIDKREEQREQTRLGGRSVGGGTRRRFTGRNG